MTPQEMSDEVYYILDEWLQASNISMVENTNKIYIVKKGKKFACTIEEVGF